MKYQLTCPKCKHEFAYDSGYYDKNIERLKHEITSIEKQLAEHRMLPVPEQKRRTDWWLRTKKAKAEKIEQLTALKAIRKVADQQIKAMEYQLFKSYFVDQYGEQAFFEIQAKVKTEMEAYQASGLMRHEYSRSGAKSSVTSINKL